MPLSNSTNTPGVGQDLWVLGVILAAAGMLMMACCIVGDDRPPPRARDDAAADAGVHLDRARHAC